MAEFNIGDDVEHPVHGYGFVIDDEANDEFPIEVLFDDSGDFYNFTREGVSEEGDGNITIAVD